MPKRKNTTTDLNPGQRLMRDQQAAQYLGISRSHFRKLVSAGKLPQPINLDGAVAWDRLSLDEAVDDLKDQDINTFDKFYKGPK